jgi:hypothetical protein
LSPGFDENRRLTRRAGNTGDLDSGACVGLDERKDQPIQHGPADTHGGTRRTRAKVEIGGVSRQKSIDVHWRLKTATRPEGASTDFMNFILIQINQLRLKCGGYTAHHLPKVALKPHGNQ